MKTSLPPLARALGIAAIGVTTASAVPSKELTAEVATRTAAAMPKVIELRRAIHRHPELSNREVKTARLIADRLKEIGVDEVRTGVAKTGVIGYIHGAKKGRAVALRADMDALPVQEKTGLPYASAVPGVSHACGHDSHVAGLLGAAEVLVGMRADFAGTVVLLFQPAEEGPPPGEEGGAALMVKEGALEGPRPEAVFGLHAWTELLTGQIGWRAGGIMAGVDQFKVTITGRQAHGAYPWEGADPVVAASHVVTALQTVVSRAVDTRDPAVVTVGVIRGGQRWNIIPSEVVLEGTIRTHDEDVREKVLETFGRVVNATALAHDTEAVIEVTRAAPVTWNDPELARRMRGALVAAAGSPDKVVEPRPAMGGEDFAFYAQEVPAMYFFLGMGHGPGTAHGHTPEFLVDEDALPIGVRALSLLALDFLAGGR